MTPHDRAALRIQSTMEVLSVTDPWLFLMAMLCDVILDDTVVTAATNGVDLLINPYFACESSVDELSSGLQGAVLDALLLHPVIPHGVSYITWVFHTHEKLMRTASLRSNKGIHIVDRLRPPPPGIDPAIFWGRRACWARQFLGALDPVPPLWMPVPRPGENCLSCSHGEHHPYVHPQFEAITRGSSLAPSHVPTFAEDGFCTVWALTSPVLSLDDYQHGLEWLARCGADAWLFLAMKRLLPVLERQGRLRDWLDCCRNSPPLRRTLLRLFGLHRREGQPPWLCAPRDLTPRVG